MLSGGSAAASGSAQKREVEVLRLFGSHVTACGADVSWGVRGSFSPADAIAQAAKARAFAASDCAYFPAAWDAVLGGCILPYSVRREISSNNSLDLAPAVLSALPQVAALLPTRLAAREVARWLDRRVRVEEQRACSGESSGTDGGGDAPTGAAGSAAGALIKQQQAPPAGAMAGKGSSGAAEGGEQTRTAHSRTAGTPRRGGQGK